MNKLLILALFFVGAVHAEAPAAGKPNWIKYVPPMRGAPASRVGGGSRGTGDDLPRLQVLAPDHTGLTLREQPTLYWYVSKPTVAHFEVTVINDKLIDPLVDQDFEMPAKAGIQRLHLADFGVKLKTGIEYRWYVSLVVDPAQRSNDIVASGTIERIAPSVELEARLAHAENPAKPRIYAESGIWYDALDALSDLAEKDSAYRKERAELLDEVGLGEAAALDRQK